MRISKNAEERKNEILDTANKLFNQKGFDGTSIQDIQEEVGIARGTLYYHFKSKEEILDALIDKYKDIILINAKKSAYNPSLSIMERFEDTLKALNIEKIGGSALIQELNTPQNALMHQKTRVTLIKNITPILSDIIEEGIKENVFHTNFPYESIELLMTYVISVFDDHSMSFSQQEMCIRIDAFIENAEKILGVPTGQFIWMKSLFE